MPKIVTYEYDKTTAGISEYANFTVVIPGFVKTGYGTYADGTSVFDENDVYECNSRADFVKYIGKVPMSESLVKEAIAAVPEDDEITTEAQFDAAKAESLALGATTHLYAGVANAEQIEGYLKTVDYDFEDGIITEETPYVEGTYYKLIADANKGSDAVYGSQMGNQVAYELLGMGYTILYKKLELVSDLSKADYWECFKDKAMYDFRYVDACLIDGNDAVNQCIIDLVHFDNKVAKAGGETGRGDATALINVDEEVYAKAANQATAIKNIASAVKGITGSKYAAIFAPTVTYDIADRLVQEYGNNKTFPATFHYLACAAKAAENYNEWYANAGYTRGISDYSIAAVGYKFGEAAIDLLEPRNDKGGDNTNKAVNLIVKIKNSYFLWGNRTAYTLGAADSADGDLKASHFLNIRQLCSTIKKQTYVACRRFTFDPNSDLLWVKFCNALRPTLEKMKGDQGIEDYKFVKVKSVKKATLTAKIRIVPIEAVEDFDIGLYLEDSLGNINVVIDEEDSLE